MNEARTLTAPDVPAATGGTRQGRADGSARRGSAGGGRRGSAGGGRRGRSRRPAPLTISGVLGELLITLGVLLGLFLVWQLFWTDVVAMGEQDQIIAAADEDWGALDTETIAAPQDGPPPVPSLNGEDNVFAMLHVPAFDRVRTPIAEGTDMERVLNVKGAGHYSGTALPGEVGNFSLAGHRNTFGRPFEDIARLKEGDPIVVETPDAFLVYRVTEHLIVQPEDVEVIAPNPDDPTAQATDRMLTMTACHPMFSARERYIVHAEFDYWTKRSDGIPEALAGVED